MSYCSGQNERKLKDQSQLFLRATQVHDWYIAAICQCSICQPWLARAVFIFGIVISVMCRCMVDMKDVLLQWAEGGV